MFKRLIAAGAGIIAAAAAVLPVHGQFGCGTAGIGAGLGCGLGPAVVNAWAVPWAPWGPCGLSLGQWMFGLGMILPSWGMPWSWW